MSLCYPIVCSWKSIKGMFLLGCGFLPFVCLLVVFNSLVRAWKRYGVKWNLSSWTSRQDCANGGIPMSKKAQPIRLGGFKVGESWLACQLASCLAHFFWQADLPACRQVKLLYTPLPTFIIFFHSSLHGSIAERLSKWQASQLASTLSPANMYQQAGPKLV